MKVTVTVRGIHSPPGRVTVTAKRGSVTRTTSVRLTYSNRGLRVLTLPRLQAGSLEAVGAVRRHRSHRRLDPGGRHPEGRALTGDRLAVRSPVRPRPAEVPREEACCSRPPPA
nr:hypothetical protein [Angustibacter aerolatus]